MNPGDTRRVFEEDKSEEEHRIETQQRRLKEGTSELLEQYAELLKSAQIDSNEVAQDIKPLDDLIAEWLDIHRNKSG